jgi:RNA polymerase sigma-70 factor (ECF subfamily)
MRREQERLHEQVIGLSRRYGPLVYRIARRYAETPAEVDDLTQDIWVRVIDILPRKNPASPMEGWLCVVAANVGMEHRKRARRGVRSMNMFAWMLPRTDSRQPEYTRVNDSTTERIWKAIDALPPLQRRVLLHRVFEGLSTEETARAIQRAEGTVKASLHRALKALNAELADLQASWSADDL